MLKDVFALLLLTLGFIYAQETPALERPALLKLVSDCHQGNHEELDRYIRELPRSSQIQAISTIAESANEYAKYHVAFPVLKQLSRENEERSFGDLAVSFLPMKNPIHEKQVLEFAAGFPECKAEEATLDAYGKWIKAGKKGDRKYSELILSNKWKGWLDILEERCRQGSLPRDISIALYSIGPRELRTEESPRLCRLLIRLLDDKRKIERSVYTVNEQALNFSLGQFPVLQTDMLADVAPEASLEDKISFAKGWLTSNLDKPRKLAVGLEGMQQYMDKWKAEPPGVSSRVFKAWFDTDFSVDAAMRSGQADIAEQVQERIEIWWRENKQKPLPELRQSASVLSGKIHSEFSPKFRKDRKASIQEKRDLRVCWHYAGRAYERWLERKHNGHAVIAFRKYTEYLSLNGKDAEKRKVAGKRLVTLKEFFDKVGIKDPLYESGDIQVLEDGQTANKDRGGATSNQVIPPLEVDKDEPIEGPDKSIPSESTSEPALISESSPPSRNPQEGEAETSQGLASEPEVAESRISRINLPIVIILAVAVFSGLLLFGLKSGRSK